MTDRTAWFRDARYGMFIHFSINALKGRGEWVQHLDGFTTAEMQALTKDFNPHPDTAKRWAALAKRSGMRYVVLTAKHHEGFCLWPSTHTDFHVGNTPYGRDLLGEAVAAMRAEGLKVGIYLSCKDWSLPSYWQDHRTHPEAWANQRQRFHDHLREIVTGYEPDLLWFDGSDDPNVSGTHWGAQHAEIWGHEEVKRILDLRPDMLYNQRSGLAGDFVTPEQEIPMSGGHQHFEACQTTNWSWAFKPDDLVKPARELLRQLLFCACRGGNLLLNVAPDPDGNVRWEQARPLIEVGEWLRHYGAPIYRAKRELPDWWDHASFGRILCDGSTAWLAVNHWPQGGFLDCGMLANQVRAAKLIGDEGRALTVTRTGRRLHISGLPEWPPSTLLNLIELELDGPVREQRYF